MVATDGDQTRRPDAGRPRDPSNSLARALDRGERLGDGVRVAGDVAGIGELQVSEWLNVELRVVLRPESTRCLAEPPSDRSGHPDGS